MPQLVISLLLTALVAGPGDSAAVTARPGQPAGAEEGTMVFVVTNAYGSARDGSGDAIVVGVTEARTPEQAIDQFRPEYTKPWVLHKPTRTDTYARVEDPASFVSDMISYYAAQAGQLVRGSEGKIRFLVGAVGLQSPRAPGDERPAPWSDTVWAVSAREALLSKFGPKPRGKLVERGTGGLYATLLMMATPREAALHVQAAADVVVPKAGE